VNFASAVPQPAADFADDQDGRYQPVRGAEPLWLTEVRLRAARRVLWLRHLWSGRQYEGEHLLAISHSEVDRALAPPGEAAAAALNPAVARVFGYLLDVTEAADPTPALAATLFDLTGQPPGSDSALLRWLLAEPVVSGRDAFARSTGWRVDALLLPALAGAGDASAHRSPLAGDWAEGMTGRVVEPPPDPVLRPEALEEIVGFVQKLGQDEGVGLPVEIELAGAAGSGRTALAAQAAARLGSRLVAVDAATLASRADAPAAATREARRARLDGLVVEWEHADALPAELWQAIPSAPLTFLSVQTPMAGTGEVTGHRTIRRSVRCGPIGRGERLRLWASLAATPPPTAVAEWALRPAEIHVAAHVATAGDQEVGEVCRRLLMAGTPELLDPLPLPFTWADLVLSPGTTAHLRELEAQAADRSQVLDDWRFSRLTSLGRGMTALFAGPSGTGKTMAAQVLTRAETTGMYSAKVGAADLAGGADSRSAGVSPSAPARAWPRRPQPARVRLSVRQVR
jgi:hypothetical protein